jgi:outer membrane protein OmpA-like peptidoglycan-associated protein
MRSDAFSQMWRRGYVYFRIRSRRRVMAAGCRLPVAVLALTLGVCSFIAMPCSRAAAAALAVPAMPGAPSRALRRELDRAEAQLRKSLLPLEAGPATQILREPRRVLLRIPARLLFDAESTIPRADAPARALLVATRQLLRNRARLTAQVEVYTDGIGGAEANLSFAQRRADALLTWLTGEGAPAARLRASGRGASEPLASDDAPEGRVQNRRVEFVFEPAQQP